MAHHGRNRRHQHRPQPHSRGVAHGFEFGETLELAAVGEFHDQDSVFGDQSNERHEAHLRIDVESGRPSIGPERNIRRGHFQEGEEQRAEQRQRHRTHKDDERVAKAVELGREDQKDQQQCENQRWQELAAFRAQLAGLARVIHHEARRHDLGCLVLEEAQRLVERADRHAAQLHGIQLLKPVQRSRLGGVFQLRHRAERHQAPLGAGDINFTKLFGVEPVRALDLRDDLVAPAADVEAVDKIPAEHRGEILADLPHIEPHRGDFVAVQHELGARLVDLGVDDRREGEHPALDRLALELLGDFEDLLRLRGGRDEEFHRKIPTARQRGRRHREHADSRKLRKFLRHFGLDFLRCAFSLAPWLEDHAAESECRLRDLESVGSLGHRQKNPRRLVGVAHRFLERRIRRGLHDPEDHALILVGREFGRRQQEHRHAQ